MIRVLVFLDVFHPYQYPATDIEFDEEEDEWYIEVCVLYDDLYMFLFCII